MNIDNIGISRVNFFKYVWLFIHQYSGTPQKVRVDMYVANIWAMEEVKMVLVKIID